MFVNRRIPCPHCPSTPTRSSSPPRARRRAKRRRRRASPSSTSSGSSGSTSRCCVALLRLTPSAAVATSGPAGSLTEVRIRGAEANHTLLFVDGIKINDPASGDAPRFELLNADLASRIEVVRGPQSALWGSEAIGGVIAVNGLDDAPGLCAPVPRPGRSASSAASASAALVTTDASLVGRGRLAARDRDRQLQRPAATRTAIATSRAGFAATWHPRPNVELGASALALTGRDEFDGFDPITFAHADTLDNSRNRLGAGRIWAEFGDGDLAVARPACSARCSARRTAISSPTSSRTAPAARGATCRAQLERRFATGAIDAPAHRRGRRRTRDLPCPRYASTAASPTRTGAAITSALTVEWRAETQAAHRRRRRPPRHVQPVQGRDQPSRLAARASSAADSRSPAPMAKASPSRPSSTFTGSFPEISSEIHRLSRKARAVSKLSLRYRTGPFDASLTGYRQRLHDEIVDMSIRDLPQHCSIAPGSATAPASRRTFGWKLGEELRLSRQLCLSQRDRSRTTRPATQVHEAAAAEAQRLGRARRRSSDASPTAPRSLMSGRISTHRDTFPFDRVTLRLLLAGRCARRLCGPARRRAVRARERTLLNQHYQDVFGYRTEAARGLCRVRLSGR